MRPDDLLQRGHLLGPALPGGFADGPPALGGLPQLPLLAVRPEPQPDRRQLPL